MEDWKVGDTAYLILQFQGSYKSQIEEKQLKCKIVEVKPRLVVEINTKLMNGLYSPTNALELSREPHRSQIEIIN